MNQLVKVIYTLIGVSLLFTVIFREIMVDIQLHDTYFVVGLSFLTIPVMIIMLLQALVYSRLLRAGKFPNVYLAVFYLTGTVISVVGIAYSLFRTRYQSASYYTWSNFEPQLLLGFVVLYCVSQLVFVLSILLFKKVAN